MRGSMAPRGHTNIRASSYTGMRCVCANWGGERWSSEELGERNYLGRDHPVGLWPDLSLAPSPFRRCVVFIARSELPARSGQRGRSDPLQEKKPFPLPSSAIPRGGKRRRRSLHHLSSSSLPPSPRSPSTPLHRGKREARRSRKEDVFDPPEVVVMGSSSSSSFPCL